MIYIYLLSNSDSKKNGRRFLCCLETFRSSDVVVEPRYVSCLVDGLFVFSVIDGHAVL